MSLGYYSVTELMAAMPEVVAIEREQKQGDWKLYDVRTYKPKTNLQNNTSKLFQIIYCKDQAWLLS